MKRKNGEYRACLKYSVPIFVEQIYKMERLEVSSAVQPIYWSLGVKRLINYELRFMLEGSLILGANVNLGMELEGLKTMKVRKIIASV